MPSSDVTINVRTRGTRQAARELTTTEKSMARLGRSSKIAGQGLRTAGYWGTRAGLALGAGMAYELGRSYRAFEESRKITASTAAVLKSTGGVANVTAKEIDSLSTSLSRKTGIDDEQITQAQNMMLTFRSVRNEVGKNNDIFTQATKASVDMAAGMTAMGKSMSVTSASVLLGKALNDPVKGAAALGRVGAISKAEVARIEEMAEAGASLRTIRAFILKQVTAQFGGQGESTATPLGKMHVAIENVEEAIGRGLAPTVDRAAKGITAFAEDAEPIFTALGKGLNDTFGRKDLDLGQKFAHAREDVRRELAPLTDEIGRELGELQLGQRLADSFERAVPAVANSVAAAAPKIGEAFWNGFWEAGPWGKLGILATAGAKLGGGGALGGIWGLRGPVGAGSPGNPIAVIGGGGGGALLGGAGGGGKKSRMGRFGSALGKGARSLPVVGSLAILAQELGVFDAFDQPGQALSGQARMRGLGYHRERNPAGRGTVNVSNGSHLVRDPSVVGRGYRIVENKIDIQIDGKTVARAVNRANADQKARR